MCLGNDAALVAHDAVINRACRISVRTACRYNLDRLEFIFSRLDELSPREREIIQGLYKDGLTQRELAARLKCTPANISILHGRAVKRLRKMVAEERKRGLATGLVWFAPVN